MQRHSVYEMDLIAQVGQPEGVRASPSSYVQYDRRRFLQVPEGDVLRAKELEPAVSLAQPQVFEAGSVVLACLWREETRNRAAPVVKSRAMPRASARKRRAEGPAGTRLPRISGAAPPRDR